MALSLKNYSLKDGMFFTLEWLEWKTLGFQAFIVPIRKKGFYYKGYFYFGDYGVRELNKNTSNIIALVLDESSLEEVEILKKLRKDFDLKQFKKHYNAPNYKIQKKKFYRFVKQELKGYYEYFTQNPPRANSSVLSSKKNICEGKPKRISSQ